MSKARNRGSPPAHSSNCSSISKNLLGQDARATHGLLITLLLPDEEMFFIHLSRDRNVKETDHHLVVGLFTPLDRTVGIGVVRIVLGIVIPGDRFELGSGG